MPREMTPCPFVLGDRNCGVQIGVDFAGPGCDKTIATCIERFDNGARFGGAPLFEIKCSPEPLLAALARNRDAIRSALSARTAELDPYLDWKLRQG